MPILAVNKRASFDYEILETYEAGLVLFGHETKSIKSGHISLNGSYVTFRGARPYLVGAQVSLYKYAGGQEDYNPHRDRQLLLKKKEIEHLIGKKQEKGLTLVPIKIYTKHSFVKLEFGVGRGKKEYDKRESIKKREVDRNIRTLTKQGLR